MTLTSILGLTRIQMNITLNQDVGDLDLYIRTNGHSNEHRTNGHSNEHNDLIKMLVTLTFILRLTGIQMNITTESRCW